jgi:hypothetical protein
MKWTQDAIEAKLAQHYAWRDTPSPSFLTDIPGTEAEQLAYAEKLEAWEATHAGPCHLADDDLSGLDFSNTDLRLVIFERCNMSGATFRDAVTGGARICSHSLTADESQVGAEAEIQKTPRIQPDMSRWSAVCADICARVRDGLTPPVIDKHLRALGLHDAVLLAAIGTAGESPQESPQEPTP